MRRGRPRSPCVALGADELRGLAGGTGPDERIEARQRAPCGGALSGPECPGDIPVGELGEVRAAGETARTSNTVDAAQQRIPEGNEDLCHVRSISKISPGECDEIESATSHECGCETARVGVQLGADVLRSAGPAT